jgi:hypothetical protein
LKEVKQWGITEEDEELPEKPKIAFKNRRITAMVGRTLKTNADKFEFLKFALGFEGDIADDVDRSLAHDQIFQEMMNEAVLREAAIKAAYKVDEIDQIVRILKSIQRDAIEKQKQREAENDTSVSKSEVAD